MILREAGTGPRSCEPGSQGCTHIPDLLAARDQIIITVLPEKAGENLFQAVAHELGHSEGMDHVSDRHAVMFGEVNGSKCVTAADGAEACDQEDCDGRQTKACE